MIIEIKNILTFFIELIKILLIMSGIMGYKFKIKWYSILTFILSLSAVIIISQNNCYRSLSLVFGLLAVICSVSLLREKNKTVCSLLAYVSVSILDVIPATAAMLITGLSALELFNSFVCNLIINSVNIIFLTAVVFYSRLFGKKQLIHIKQMRIAYITAAVVSQFCFMVYLTPALILGFNHQAKSAAVFGISISGIFFIACNIAAVEISYSKNKFKNLYKNAKIRAEELTDYFEKKLIAEKEKQKIFHDINYHILSLQSLLINNQNEKAEQYINTLADRIIQCRQEINTGNHQLNSVISGCLNKYPNSKAEINGIIPNILNISNHDFCVIISNLLDNAFRAANGINGTVKLDLNLNEKLYIKITNPVTKKIIIKDNEIYSVKKYGQGIGMINVKEYVNKNGGKVFYRCDNKKFTAELFLVI